jgi:nitroreductase
MENKGVIELMECRRTFRRFDEQRKIPNEVVEKIKYSARLASSAANRQPLRYIYVRDVEMVNKIFDLTAWGGAIPNGEGRPKVGERPTMFVVVLYDKSLYFKKFTDFDAGLAVSNMTLAAYECGVGSCIIGSVNIDKLKTLLNISEPLEVSVAVAFGYPAHQSRIEYAKGGDVKYYMDEDRNYVVPKRTDEETVTEI